MMRSLLTVISGLVSGMLAGRFVLFLGRNVAPPPADLNPGDLEAVKRFVAAAPTDYFVLLLAAWAVGAFVGGLVAGLLAPNHRVWHAVAVGMVQAAVAAVQLLAIPHPPWVVMSALALFVPIAWLGGRLFSGAPDIPA
jgi:hypothetical protein